MGEYNLARMKQGYGGLGGALLMGLLLSCSGKPPAGIGVRDGRLAPCPSSPNCVCSDAVDPKHRIDPIRIEVPAERAWEAAREVLSGWRRTRIVAEAGGYLRAECESTLFGFVDDLEIHLRPEEGMLAVRSAARLGHSDMGANRRRVERLREALRARGVAR